MQGSLDALEELPISTFSLVSASTCCPFIAFAENIQLVEKGQEIAHKPSHHLWGLGLAVW